MLWWKVAFSTLNAKAVLPAALSSKSFPLAFAGLRREMADDNVEAGTEGDILNLDARTLSDKLRSRELTCAQLMEVTLDRVDESNPSLGALISVRSRKDLLEEARRADAMQPTGWLYGVPIAIKDMANVKELPTTMGGAPALCNGGIASEDDLFVQRLVDEGAIVIGKTNSPELGIGSHTFNSKWPTTVNPYNTDKSAGGSSGGAAVALSARILCVADGSDMMGSLRNPAGWNNIYSHRPTAGMIEKDSDNDVNPLPYPISTVGSMARTPLDVAMLLQTMAGRDEFDASSVASEPDVSNMHIGWLRDWGGAYVMEPGIVSLCQDALSNGFSQSGQVMVSTISEPPMAADKLWQSWTNIRSKIISSDLAATYGKEAILAGKVPVKEEALWEAKRGFALKDSDVEEAAKIANEWGATVNKLFENYDALVLPTAQVWPFPAEWRWPKTIEGKDMDTYHRWMEVVVPGTLAGLPCTTIPAGFGDNALPMGMQLIGARGTDSKLLSLAQFYHQRTDWPRKRPP